MPTVIIALVVALMVGAAIWKMASDKRKGKGCCGGDCSRCKGCH